MTPEIPKTPETETETPRIRWGASVNGTGHAEAVIVMDGLFWLPQGFWRPYKLIPWRGPVYASEEEALRAARRRWRCSR